MLQVASYTKDTCVQTKIQFLSHTGPSVLNSHHDYSNLGHHRSQDISITAGGSSGWCSISIGKPESEHVQYCRTMRINHLVITCTMDDSPMLHPRIETPKSTYCRLFLYNTEAEEWSEQRGCCLGKEHIKGSKRKGGGTLGVGQAWRHD